MAEAEEQRQRKKSGVNGAMQPRRRLTQPFADQPPTCWFCREPDSLSVSYLNSLSMPDASDPSAPVVAICSRCVLALAAMTEITKLYNVIHRAGRDWKGIECRIAVALRRECGTERQKTAVAEIVLRVAQRACLIIAGTTEAPTPIRIELVGDKVLSCANLFAVACATVGIVCIPVLSCNVRSGLAWRTICSRANGDPAFAAPTGMLVVLDGHADGCAAECSVVFLDRSNYGLNEYIETVHVD